jgi:ABC-2 type transport system ATP-binding protein
MMVGMTSEVVRTSGLSRRFDNRLAVDDLSLSVDAGEVLSLLGPNGAGKTTTFRMIAALLLPTRGQVVVAGTPLTAGTADQIRGRVGLLTEAPGLWERLTVRANLLTYARLHGVADDERRVTAVMRDVGIDDRADERAGALSKGLKQRVAIARALVHDPPVVLLDEPTSGLDPANARHVRDLIGRLRADGRGVLVSTHNLAEAEELSDRIAVLNTRLLACDTPRRLREQRSGGTVVVEVEGDAGRWTAAIPRAPGSLVLAEGGRLVARVAGPRDVPEIVAALVAAGARITRVEPRDASLEEAYLALVEADDA